MSVVPFPKRRHARASNMQPAASRRSEAKRANSSAVSPASEARGVDRIVDQTSGGMLSRCHHFETCGGVAPSSAAQDVRVGQRSMTSRNEFMPRNMGQIVPAVKDHSSQDCEQRAGHNVSMTTEDTEAAFLAAFKQRLIQIQGRRTDAEMAELLEIPTDRYKKYKNRPKSEFPLYLLSKLRLIAAMSFEELLGLKPEPQAAKRQTKRRHAAAA